MSQSAIDGRTEREELILSHMPQVRSIARQTYDRVSQYVSMDDLISAGVLGLISAVDNYDPSMQAKLSTYAEIRIRGAILDSLRGLDWAPRLKRKKAKAIDEAISRAEQRLQRTPSEDDIAAELNISLTEYREWLVEIQSANLTSIDTESSDSSSGWSLLNVLSGPEAEQPLQLAERKELRQLVAAAIRMSPEIEQTVLSLYYEQEVAPHEIAEILGLRLSRVSQIKAQALARVRAYLQRQLKRKSVTAAGV
jgi:RNA polymerase sigma factor FliA